VTSVTHRPEVHLVTCDLYRDVHKGIRAELFSLTEEAGRLDPDDRSDRAALAAHLHAVVDLLVGHARHEENIQPTLEEHLPRLAEQVASDHTGLETRLHDLVAFADTMVNARRGSPRPTVHRLYLELATFTKTYLEHQDVEERVVMPALESALGADVLTDIHQEIIASISPERLARYLAVMLPAMNVDDRAELLGGMQEHAPSEVFQDIWSLTGSVLTQADLASLARRLGSVRHPDPPDRGVNEGSARCGAYPASLIIQGTADNSHD
jgi:iron-sulfur cluster repair protein YtfE (RIC family)